MRWVCLVLLAKDMTQNLNCFKDLYKDVDTTVVVNIQLGRWIMLKRSIGQGHKPSSFLFYYGVDPLDNQLKGITIYSLPQFGPLNQTSNYFNARVCHASLRIHYVWKINWGHITQKSRIEKMQDTSTMRMKRLTQNEIAISYLTKSDHLDMLGFIVHSTYTQTRTANGDVVRDKTKKKMGPWKSGKFMLLTDRPWSINC